MPPAHLTRPAAAAAVLAAVAAIAGAQDFSAERSGMTASIGLGPSSAGVSCVPRCQGDRRSGPNIQIRAGAQVSAVFTIALEANLYGQDVPLESGGDGSWDLSFISLEGLWYPRSEGDVFVKFGAGVGTVKAHLTFPDVGAFRMNSRDLGFIFGVGRDIRFGEHFGVTGFVDYMSTARSTAYISGSDSGARISADVLVIGLAATVF